MTTTAVTLTKTPDRTYVHAEAGVRLKSGTWGGANWIVQTKDGDSGWTTVIGEHYFKVAYQLTKDLAARRLAAKRQ